jgi:SMP-30/Gluconolactonase/LRE-like region
MQITRRNLLTAGAGAVTMPVAPSVTPSVLAAWEPSDRYPDPAIQILDPSFAKYRLNNAGVERIATGMRWAEGPVWFGDGRYLLWSDAALDRIMRWDEETGQVSVFRKPANKPNGLTRDRQGRLLTCEHAGRRVTRTEYDGTITVLIDRFDGKRLNSPNDIVVKSDDSIWFTDPVYGITSNYSGVIDTQELPTNVYRLDKTGRATVVAGDINRPDGLAFSPDETKLYIIEDGTSPQVFRVTISSIMTPGSPTGEHSSPSSGAASPTAFASMSTEICGAVGAGVRGTMELWSSMRPASPSAGSIYRSAARTSVSAAFGAAGCSWRRATRSIRSSCARKARLGAEKGAGCVTDSAERKGRHRLFRSVSLE